MCQLTVLGLNPTASAIFSLFARFFEAGKGLFFSGCFALAKPLSAGQGQAALPWCCNTLQICRPFQPLSDAF